MTLVPYWSRSKFWWIQVAKISNIFCGRSYEINFRDITWRPGTICFPQGNLLSSCICWHLKFEFLVLFANLKFGIPDLSFPEISGLWISCNFAWSEYICFTWICSLFPEISYFCYSWCTLSCAENHPLNTFRWQHVRGYATTYVILISLLLDSELRRWAVPIACVT